MGAIRSRLGDCSSDSNYVCPNCGQVLPTMVISTHTDACLYKSFYRTKPSSSELSSQDFLTKNRLVRDRLASIRVPWQQGAVSLEFDRNNLLEESWKRLRDLTVSELRSEFKIGFRGEVVNDAGGAVKEWIYKVNNLLLAQETGLFRYTVTEETAYRFCPLSPQLHYAEMTGIILGKALLEGIPINCPLSRVLFKHLLGEGLNIEDLRYLNVTLYEGLKFIHENRISDLFFETFSVLESRPGNAIQEVIDLWENGRNIAVTDENKVSYISLRSEWELVKSMQETLDAFKIGFGKVVPDECLSGVLAEELELAICGLRVIDVEDWKQNTEYKGEFHSNHTVVRWFWEALHGFSQAELAALLQFVMGTTRLPVEGFRTLRTLRGDSAKFTLEPVQYEGGTQFPRAHTCFNRLDLPLYRYSGELRLTLLYVINNHNEGFGLE